MRPNITRPENLKSRHVKKKQVKLQKNPQNKTSKIRFQLVGGQHAPTVADTAKNKNISPRI